MREGRKVFRGGSADRDGRWARQGQLREQREREVTLGGTRLQGGKGGRNEGVLGGGANAGRI